VIDDLQIPEIKPNAKLRNMLRNKSAGELFKMLKKLDPKRATNIDAKNPVRLIRAIEIVKTTGKPVPIPATPNPVPALILGLKLPQAKLYKLIDERLESRLKAGMVTEVKKLLKQKISHKRLQEMGLEYRFISLYLLGHFTYDEMVLRLKHAIHKFSKRQMTWFKTDSRIKWITSEKQAEKFIKFYLK
jgi:tRNA dimethylallyltransferase